jgi:hypothetical protein
VVSLFGGRDCHPDRRNGLRGVWVTSAGPKPCANDTIRRPATLPPSGHVTGLAGR